MVLRLGPHSLRAVQWPPSLSPVNIRNNYHGVQLPLNISRVLCTPCGRSPVIFTVTKKARPKQSSDMNFKAWDNNEAARGLPFRLLLVLKICGRLWHGVTSGSEPLWVSPTPSRCVPLVVVVRFTFARNEGGLFGGERT